jgi:hypothetical protein
MMPSILVQYNGDKVETRGVSRNAFGAWVGPGMVPAY